MRRLVLALALAGCATEGGRGGGADDLPNRGIVPYEKVALGDAGTPVVLPPPADERFTGATALARDGRVLLFVALQGTGSRIARAESDDGVAFGPLETVLSSDRPLADPSVAVAGDTWHLALTLDGKAIGHARGDGHAFTLDADPILAPTGDEVLGGPSLVPDGDGFRLYYAVRDGANAPARVALAVSGADLRFTRRGDVLAPGTDCESYDGKPQACWDADGVDNPEVRRARSATGRDVWRLFYVGRQGANGGIGFAASDDGVTWARYAYNPVLGKGERDPSDLRLDDRYLLYFLQGLRGAGVGLAVDDQGRPADAF